MIDYALRWTWFLLAFGLAGSAYAGTVACPVNANPGCLPGFPVEFSGPGIPADVGYVRFSSPAVTHLGLVNDAMADIVVGTTGGYVVAYHADGTFLWATKTGDISVDSKPAIADIDGDGKLEIVVGAGDASKVGGGVYVLRHDGTLKCSFTALDTAPLDGGVYSSPALARLDNTRPTEMQIVFGSWDAHVRALHADCSLWWVKGVSDGVIDTVWSSPAIYDLDGDGQLDVIIGQDSGIGNIPGTSTQIGGMVRAFRGNGVGELPGFPIALDDVIWSSPAIGDLLGTGHPAIAVGKGRCWDVPACAPGGNTHSVTDVVYGWNAGGTALSGWPYATPNQAAHSASPALADLDGDGKLETIISGIIKADNTGGNDRDAYMQVIRSDGTAYPGWPRQPFVTYSCTSNVHWLTAFGSPIVVDLNGDGKLEIIGAGGRDLVVWDRNGNQLTRMAPGACAGPPDPSLYQLQAIAGINSTPTAADLVGDGHIELIVGSAGPYPSSSPGGLTAWQFPNSVAIPDNMPWPQFRANALNTGVYTPDLIFKNGFD
jgi:hypothetical protein